MEVREQKRVQAAPNFDALQRTSTPTEEDVEALGELINRSDRDTSESRYKLSDDRDEYGSRYGLRGDRGDRDSYRKSSDDGDQYGSRYGSRDYRDHYGPRYGSRDDREQYGPRYGSRDDREQYGSRYGSRDDRGDRDDGDTSRYQERDQPRYSDRYVLERVRLTLFRNRNNNNNNNNTTTK